MSAYYDLYETPVPEGEEPKSLHARVCSKGTISGKEFMERVFREEHMPHAMVVGIVQAITTTLGDWLAKVGGEITLYVNYERVKCGSNAYE